MRVRGEPRSIHVDFDESIDPSAVRDLIAVERDSCPFVVFRWNQATRRLSVSTADATMTPRSTPSNPSSPER
jgi:hypothetical protein